VPIGYHSLRSRGGAERPLIVHPGRCHDSVGPRRWGLAVQLYAARSRASWGMGDLADLRRLARWTRDELGGRFLLVNPLAATTTIGSGCASPYSPATRRFRNPIYLRIEDVPGAGRLGADLDALAARGRALDRERTIDRDAVWSLKRDALEALWPLVREDADFAAWYRAQGDDLRDFAVWSTLVEELGPCWRRWPAEYRHPSSPAVARVRHERDERVRYHAWLQWLVTRQLDAAADELPLVNDLPIGFDPDGMDAWQWQDMLASDARIGAPPDAFNQRGQDWGLPPFVPWRLRAAGYRPFIDTIAATLRSAGALRVDHAMGLFRLWWVPRDGSPRDGAYVRYPAEDLLAILAIESHRAGATIVGEDLGTVEEDARTTLDVALPEPKGSAAQELEEISAKMGDPKLTPQQRSDLTVRMIQAQQRMIEEMTKANPAAAQKKADDFGCRILQVYPKEAGAVEGNFACGKNFNGGTLRTTGTMTQVK